MPPFSRQPRFVVYSLPAVLPESRAKPLPTVLPPELGETSNELTDSVPTDLKFSGETINFYIRDDLTIAEFDAEETGDIIDDAVHKRNRDVSERLGVDFNFIEGPGAWGGREEFTRNVTTSVMANDQAYDIIGGYSMATAALAVGDYLCDLNDTEYLDFSKPWWSDSLLKEATINGHLFIASGDIATSLTGSMYAVFFNKQIRTRRPL